MYSIAEALAILSEDTRERFFRRAERSALQPYESVDTAHIFYFALLSALL